MCKRSIITLSLLVTVSCLALGPTKVPSPYIWENAPELTDTTNVYLYSHYMVVPACSSLQCVDFSIQGRYNGYDMYYRPWPNIFADYLGGEWRILNDTITLYEYTRACLHEEYEYYNYTWKYMTDYAQSIRQINIQPIGENGGRGDNVSFGTIRNFGQSIDFASKENGIEYKLTMVYVPGVKYFSDRKDMIFEIFPNMTQQEYNREYYFCMSYNTDPRLQLTYFPWKQTKCDWQRGRFDIVAKQIVGKEIVKVELQKDSLRFSIVNPRHYLPGNGMKLYRNSEEKSLSKWMQKVKVGESYEFELMRPAYPTDSIADFPPLQTVADSIYAAEGEAYGYFFARLKK